jgi:hypothetical protein
MKTVFGSAGRTEVGDPKGHPNVSDGHKAQPMAETRGLSSLGKKATRVGAFTGNRDRREGGETARRRSADGSGLLP